MAEMVTGSCEVCGAPTAVLASQFKRGRGRTCSKSCAANKGRMARWDRMHSGFSAYFWAWVDRSGGERACWPWVGKILSKGYGRYRLFNKSHFAHRFALTDTRGAAPPDKPFALHSCDNPICCNPAHLRWGTPADNMADRAARGRDRTGRGKIDSTELLRRRKAGESYSGLAAHFGVNQSSIGRALARAEKRMLAALSVMEGR